MIQEPTSKSCLWAVRGLGLGTDLKNTASGTLLLANCFSLKSRLRSDNCWNNSSIVWPPPVFAAADGGTDEATGATSSRRTDWVGAMGAGFGAVRVTSAFPDAEEGCNEAAAGAPSGCTDTAGAAGGGEGVIAAGALPAFAPANGVAPDEVAEVAPPG
jgi:hypothetical protein